MKLLVSFLLLILLGSCLPVAHAGQTVHAGLQCRKHLKARGLTRREEQVLALVARGLSNKQIADELGVCPKTIDKHRQKAMETLNIHGIAGLTRYAIRHGLLLDVVSPSDEQREFLRLAAQGGMNDRKISENLEVPVLEVQSRWVELTKLIGIRDRQRLIDFAIAEEWVKVEDRSSP